MLEKVWWRALQVLTPLALLVLAWANWPTPKLEHSQSWLDAQSKRASYQYDDSTASGQAATIALAGSAEKMVASESTRISAMTNPLERLTAMSNAEVRLTRMLSKHPMWPGMIAPWLQEDLRQAAGIGGGQWSDPEMIRVAQANTALLSAAYDEEQRIMKQYGFGVSEPLALTAPYYLSWWLRLIILLTMTGLTGTLVLGCKLRHFGYDWKKVAVREYGSLAIAFAVAPFANIFMLEAYEEPGAYGNCAVDQDVSITDALRLSFSFRAAIVATIAAVLTNLFNGAHVAMAADEPPVVVSTTTYVDLEDPNAKVNNELRAVAPQGNGTAFQVDYNLNSGMFDLGIRGRNRTLMGNTKFQPRVLAVFDKNRFAMKFQGFTIGKGWSLFSSLKLPEGARASLYNELAADVGKIGQTQVQAVLIESNTFGDQAKWQAGPLFNIPMGKGTLSVLGAFGLGGGGPGDQLRVQYTVSF
jgi:hypothetical protein